MNIGLGLIFIVASSIQVVGFWAAETQTRSGEDGISNDVDLEVGTCLMLWSLAVMKKSFTVCYPACPNGEDKERERDPESLGIPGESRTASPAVC